ncbi:NACHT domain-containing protein [Streptomyces sp. NPDC050982]|uniref:NACHT domain-containing protein n=1 Tax=Streptomyces sp. NPDC050982 TaxID=3154746 RepID=UPI003400C61B
MGASRTRRTAIVFLVLQIASMAVALWLSKQFQVARLAVTAIALVPTLPGAYLSWVAYRADRAEPAADVDPKIKTLAAAVAASETRQRKQLIGTGAHRIDLVFHYQHEPANNATGAEPEGHLANVVDYYRQLRPARLVITGEPGAGKTMLALDLLLGLLADSEPTDRVPVRVSLAGWDTTRPLADWLADQVCDQLQASGLTVADARILVDQHRVLPVLDGLDEMDTDATPVSHRRAVCALEQLNAYQDPTGNAPLILTCRTARYHELAAMDVRMREAARIEIAPVDARQAGAYLTARSVNPARWTPVLNALAADSDGILAETLSTPWRLNLAVTAYEERHRDTLAFCRDPANLRAFPSVDALRAHLLAAYLPAATHQHPAQPSRYRTEQVHRWLTALATHLTITGAGATSATTGTRTDLVLHELWPLAGPHRVRMADVLIATLLALAITTTLLVQVSVDLSTRQLLAAAPLVLYGLLAMGLASSANTPRPRTSQLQLLRNPAHRGRLARPLLGWLAGGLAAGIPFGLATGTPFGLAGAITIGIAAGFAHWLVFGLTAPAAALARTDGLASPTNPRYPIRDDLLIGLLFGVAVALGTEVVFEIVAEATLGTMSEISRRTVALSSGLMVGLAVGLYLITGAGRRYLVFLCCARGRLPWRLGAFLHWAYGAGLLRVSGMAYQFRHRELQDWLTTHPAPGATPRPRR